MSVSREKTINTLRLCPCGKEPCRPGQRNGRKCAAAANRAYRKRQADKRAAEQRLALAGIAARLRSINKGVENGG